MASYSIEPERRTLHGPFSRERQAVLTIESGDSICFRTLDAGWGLEPSREDGVKSRKFELFDAEQDKGHALCGPIAIHGAEPGMTLEVHINEVVPGAWGWTVAGGWESDTNQRLGAVDLPAATLNWTLDVEKMIGHDQYGHTVALRPFVGVMGMPPAEPGYHPTSPPRRTGGNIDCKELVAGTSLYLPIEVPGGLFSVGDGHAVQGDGESGGTAIECPMERVNLSFYLHKDMDLKTPRARTVEGWLTFGFSSDLNEAMATALDAMLDLMNEQYGLSRAEALALSSLVVDLRITQVVNGVRGVHAVLPHGAIR
ncbi:MAG: acetamidase/formamidase family protein [Chloroflexota bacterium]|nr:acetamidase/formamidase family protein [Chloroflexota bacterium]